MAEFIELPAGCFTVSVDDRTVEWSITSINVSKRLKEFIGFQ